MPAPETGLINLLQRLTAPPSSSQSITPAQAEPLDPTSPDLLKEIAAQLVKVKETGKDLAPETTRTLDSALKAHLDYNANLQLLGQLNKAYSTKFGAPNK